MLSTRAQKIKPFIAMDVLEAARKLEAKGKSVISFSIGEPDFDAPTCVIEACIRALKDKKTKYTHSQGLAELREAIADHYFGYYRVKVDPEQIIVTQGTSPAFFLVFSALLNSGDEVILPNPHYPCDESFIEFLDGRIRFLEIREEEGYQWNSDRVREMITPKTRALFVTSPSNPTGTVLEEEVLEALSHMPVPVVSDEIYHRLVYEGKEHTFLEFSKNCFVVNGFSKAYAMTGFRMGYVIAPAAYVRSLQKIQQNFFICANSFVQYATIAALRDAGPDVARMRREFARRRDVMLAGLEKLGFKIRYSPQGAFYVFVNARHISTNSYDLAFDILNRAHVAVTPGIDFGSAGEGYLRFSYACSVEKIEEGLERLKKYLERTSQ